MTAPKLKTASFTVRATMAQSIAWKRAAEAEGHRAVGTWLAEAADRHLEAVKRSGKPLPLAWRRESFMVTLESGQTVPVRGFISAPFATYRGTPAKPYPLTTRGHTLLYLPSGRVIATLRTYVQVQALAAELSRVWARWGGTEPAEDPGPVVERHVREAS